MELVLGTGNAARGKLDELPALMELTVFLGTDIHLITRETKGP